MTDEQYRKAGKMKDERHDIKRELEVWEKELTKPSKMGYLQGWNNLHPTELETKMPVEIFDACRTATMNALKLRLTEIESEFAEL
jgi:hypothetical protein